MLLSNHKIRLNFEAKSRFDDIVDTMTEPIRYFKNSGSIKWLVQGLCH